MSIVDFADEKLEPPDMVRPDRPPVGHAITKHADTRHHDRLSGHVSARGDEHLRGTGHNTTVRNFRRAIY